MAKFPEGKINSVSTLCLDHYVTDQRPILCLGSQLGDVAVYYLDHVNPDGRVGEKLIVKFNFFERGINKVDEGTDDDDDVDSLLDRGLNLNQSGVSHSGGFVVKVGQDRPLRVLN